jgi:putative Mg2+ transporter-C (MgtC) family protein
MGEIFQHCSQDMQMLLRLAISLVLTGALGWERNRSGKFAGVRTHMIVGMGACFFVMLPVGQSARRRANPGAS